MKKIIILGAGMAGIGTAHHFLQNNIKTIIFEKNDYPGGQAASFEKNGFTFERGLNFLSNENERLRNLFLKEINQQVEIFNAKISNFWEGYWINNPLLLNLHGLPKQLVKNIVWDFFETSKLPDKPAENFRDRLYKMYGKYFTETFLLDFTQKFYTAPPEKLTADFFENIHYQPNLLEVVAGANSSCNYNIEYRNDYLYPSKGGFASFIQPLASKLNIEYTHEVREVNPVQRTISFKNNKTEKYDYLISSIPLTELIKRIKDVPQEILDASEKLAWSNCVQINIGVNRKNISKSHWTNFYDNDIIFSRLSFPHMFSIYNAPENCGSIQAEIFFSNKYKPIKNEPHEYIEPTIKDLQRCGVINNSDEVIFKEARFSPYVNVIFDLDRDQNLQIIHKYLRNLNIKYCGRFGDWRFERWSDESFISGENAARNIINQINLNKKIFRKSIKTNITNSAN